VGASLRAAEQAALVMLGSPSSRVAGQDQDWREPAPVISESGEEQLSGPPQVRKNEEGSSPRKDPRTLPRQVVYHFAVGRAIPDPRLEA